MDNLSYDKENEYGTAKFYFKDGKKKMISADDDLISITLEDGKSYMINKKNKMMFINYENLITKGRASV